MLTMVRTVYLNVLQHAQQNPRHYGLDESKGFWAGCLEGVS